MANCLEYPSFSSSHLRDRTSASVSLPNKISPNLWVFSSIREMTYQKKCEFQLKRLNVSIEDISTNFCPLVDNPLLNTFIIITLYFRFIEDFSNMISESLAKFYVRLFKKSSEMKIYHALKYEGDKTINFVSLKLNWILTLKSFYSFSIAL